MTEHDLQRMIREMEPVLHDGRFVFCTVPIDAKVSADAIGTFEEDNAMTVILPEERAKELGLASLFTATWITLTVHSALEAVGFLAAITAALASAGISCNVVSAASHDHLFVPYKEAARAMDVLLSLQVRGTAEQRPELS